MVWRLSNFFVFEKERYFFLFTTDTPLGRSTIEFTGRFKIRSSISLTCLKVSVRVEPLRLAKQYLIIKRWIAGWALSSLSSLKLALAFFIALLATWER